MSEEIDYSTYSDDELIKMYHQELHDANAFGVSQLVKKILLNSLYGACGNQYFLFYKTEMARAITLLGQCMINKAAKVKNEYISKCLGESEVKDRRTYSDTDSVTGDSRIAVYSNGLENKICIEDLYNLLDSPEEETITDKFVKKNDKDIYTLSIENDKVVKSKIKYVMKHKTSKHLYKLTVNEKTVIVTEDHSLMFERDGILVKGTVKDLLPTDKFIELVE